MGKQLIVVALLALVFGGAGSSALLTRAGAQSEPLSAVQQEKRLGPKPTPQWYWHWLHWRLHDRKGNQLERRLRPKDAPILVEHWAWRRLHFFLLARGEHKHHGQPSTPSGVYFDAPAKKMSKLYSYETSPGDPGTLRHSQSPNIWTCLCFTKNDISLASDSTYGKAYKAVVKTGDTNPWGGSDTIDGAGQMSIRRNNDLGKWDWWAFAVKVPAWQGVSDLRFAELVSVGYQTSQASQVAFGFTNRNGALYWSIDQNAGYANNPNGWAAGTVAYTKGFQRVVYGRWTEFVLGVKVATDQSGRVEVYSRPAGGKWSHVFAHSGATELYGVTPNGTFAQDGSNWSTVIDKLGLYFGTHSNGNYTQTVYESGLSRSSNLATAKSTLP